MAWFVMPISNYIPSSRVSQAGVCTSSTRPASPYEGQMIYETDTNRVLVYDNTAWVMIADTDTPPALELIKFDTITSGTSKEITGVFSSTYSNYRIVISNLRSVANDFGLQMRLGTTSTSIYYYGGIYSLYSSTTLSAENGSADSKFVTGIVGSSGVDTGGWIELQQPNTADLTSIQSQGTDIRTGGSGIRIYSGFINDTTQYTSFTLLTGGATFSTCDVRVYGYRN